MPVNNINSQSLNNRIVTQETGPVNHTITGRAITYTQERLNALLNIKNPNRASQCPLALLTMYNNQVSYVLDEKESNASEKFKEDINYMIYAKPYCGNKEENNIDKFFLPLIEKI